MLTSYKYKWQEFLMLVFVAFLPVPITEILILEVRVMTLFITKKSFALDPIDYKSIHSERYL